MLPRWQGLNLLKWGKRKSLLSQKARRLKIRRRKSCHARLRQNQWLLARQRLKLQAISHRQEIREIFVSMKNIKSGDIQRNWQLIDAKNKILGRLSTNTAKILMGKSKNYYTPHLDTGDYVVIINAKDVILSGKKEIKKLYIYPGSQHPYGDKKLITESTVEKQKAQNSVPSEPSRSIERGSPKATVASVITK